LGFDQSFPECYSLAEYYVLVETLLLRIKLDGLCHMTVHTDPALPQCAEVSTQIGEMRTPLQKPELFIVMAAINGTWQGCAGQPPTIFGA